MADALGYRTTFEVIASCHRIRFLGDLNVGAEDCGLGMKIAVAERPGAETSPRDHRGLIMLDLATQQQLLL